MSRLGEAVKVSEDALPVTIDNDWHRFNLEYPEIYDRFAITTPPIIDAIRDLIDFTGKVVVDVGSGTGKSTFALGGHARFVYGIEPAESMRAVAEKRRHALGLSHITFVDAAAPDLPLANQSADVLVSLYAFPWHFPLLGAEGRALGERFLAETRRALRPGGTVIANDNAPGWYGGELGQLVMRGPDEDGLARDAYLQELGFTYRDIEIEADYGSVAEAVATYGFIYGRQVIDFLIAHDKQAIRWRPRLYFRQS